ncbi:MAG: hypothetical protein EAS52_19280 [Parapedobacter sp.]|nr:MAG: hypothetical protein EAS52_19280 [Parapedobacter sp.]
MDFILLPDKPLKIDLGENVNVYPINTFIRNNKYLRLLTVLEFTVRAIFLLFRLHPRVVHTHDTAAVLPVYFYRLIRGKSFKLIYDDHEIPNEQESFQYRFFQYFERKLMKRADKVISANVERKLLLDQSLSLDPNLTTYFLNLPYFESPAKDKIYKNQSSKLQELDDVQAKGYKLIMHQGILEIERGRQKLAEFSQLLPHDIKIMLVGVSQEAYNTFITEYELEDDHFICVGIVNYHELIDYWKRADASIVMYLPTYINNRLCAPNRLYISFLNKIPIVVNKDNPVLNNFVTENGCGMFIEDVDKENVNAIFSLAYDASKIETLKNSEITKFVNGYSELLV